MKGGDAGTDTPVSSQLGQELQAATYPHASTARFLEARDREGEWSPAARQALAAELREARAKYELDPARSLHLIDGVIGALEDRR